MKKNQTIQIILLNIFFFLSPITIFAVDVNTLMKEAEKGSAWHQSSLGDCYRDGIGVLQNYQEAVKWYRKAAEQGNASAQFNLGWCYANGKGVPQNYQEAVTWYQKVAEQGNASAQFNLGWCYANGKGVPQNVDEAAKWYRKAAEQGNDRAQCILGIYYYQGSGVIKNVDESVKWIQKAAEQGNDNAQCILGLYFYEGFGVTQNFDESVKWFQKAAEQGNDEAQNYLSLTLIQVQNKILTWEQYYNNNKKVIPKYKNEEEIKQSIQADVDKWQEKGEFESTHAWKERVNDKTRNEFIRITTNNYLAQYNSDMGKLRDEQEKLAREYEAYYNKKLNSFYEFKINLSLRNFNASDFELKPYDADHETFLIHSNNFGDILLPVPVSEAPSFKQNWVTIRGSVKPEFVPNGEDVALSKLIFKNNSKEYTYDSHTRAQYAITDVNYNFAPIEMADININDITIAGVPPLQDVVSSKIVDKTNSEALTTKNAQIKHVSITASDRSDVDIVIPQNRTVQDSSTFAVIIANENYHSVSNVPYASKDGEVLEKYLTRAVGLPKDHVKIYKNASFGNMAAAMKHISNLSEAFGNDLNLIFYYAGHGMPNEKTKNPMLIPIDGDASIPETCYDLDKVIVTLGGLNANSVVVMLDACFSGSERGEGMLIATRGIRIKSNQSAPVGNMVILTASQGDETAYPYDAEQHGLFTYFLLKKLQENKGDVTLGELADYIIEQVKRQSVVSNGKIQTPSVSVSPSFQSAWRNFKLK